MFLRGLMGVFLVATSLSNAVWGGSDRAATGLETHRKTKSLPTELLGPFVRLDARRLLAVDGDSAVISHDGGNSWKESHAIVPAADLYAKVFKISPERALCRLRDGTIVLAFMNLNETVFDWNAKKADTQPGARLPTYAVRSLDGGRTWRDLQMLHEDYTGAVRDMIQTKSGTVIFTSMQLRHDPGRHTVVTYVSRDSAKTWIRSNIIDLGGAGHHGGATEGTLEQLGDGRIWMLIRTNWGRFWECLSEDDGVSWRTIRPSKIEASSSPGLMKRLKDGRLALFWNRPFPEGRTSYPMVGGDNQWSEVPVSNHRGELSVAFSDDDGKTWTKPTVLARQPQKSLAYPYFFEPEPGLIWLTTMQGDVRISLKTSDFAH
jgi:sialidase-1